MMPVMRTLLAPVAALLALCLLIHPAFAIDAGAVGDAAAVATDVASTAVAGPTEAPPLNPENPLSLGAWLIRAAQSGQWWIVLSAGLLLTVWLIRLLRKASWVPGKLKKILTSDWMAVLLTVLGSQGAALLAALSAGQAMSWQLFLHSLEIAAAASGVFSWAKLLDPKKKAPPTGTQ